MTDELVLNDLERLESHVRNAQNHAEMSETGIVVTMSAPCASCGDMSEIDYDVRNFHEFEHHCQICENSIDNMCSTEEQN